MLEIYEMPGHLIRRLNQVTVSLFVEETSKEGFDLTPVQYAALIAINSMPGLDQASVASHIAYDRVTIGGVIDRLVQKELVRRETNPNDRRARRLYLTEGGTETLKKIRPIVWRLQEELLGALEHAEREQFVSLLRKVADHTNEKSRAPLRIDRQQ